MSWHLDTAPFRNTRRRLRWFSAAVASPLPSLRRGPSRSRHRIGTIIAVGINVLWVGLATPSAYADDGTPDRFVLDFYRQLAAEFGAPGLTTVENRARFAHLIDGYIDLDGASVLMLGPTWTNAPARDQAAFRSALKDYVVRTFAGHLHGVGSHRLRFAGLTIDGESTVVATEVATAGAAALTVEWRLDQDADTGWRVTDLTISGLSLAAVMKSQFDAIGKRDGTGLAPLIAAMRGHAADQ